jgi:hypothetical protein
MTFKTVLTDVGHVSLNVIDGHYIAEALSFAEKAEAVLATAIKDSPTLKSVLTDLVAKSEALGADAVSVAGADGINLATDAKALADVEAYIAWIRATLVPIVISLYSDLKTDITSTLS